MKEHPMGLSIEKAVADAKRAVGSAKENPTQTRQLVEVFHRWSQDPALSEAQHKECKEVAAALENVLDEPEEWVPGSTARNIL